MSYIDDNSDNVHNIFLQELRHFLKKYTSSPQKRKDFQCITELTKINKKHHLRMVGSKES